MNTERHSEGGMIGSLLPELSMLLAILLLLVAPRSVLAPDPEAIYFALVLEGASLMFYCTLVDIASRVRRRPPWWAIVLIVGFVLVMYPDVIEVLKAAFASGGWIFLPLVWSFVDRLRSLWALANASDQEKIRCRTLIFDRLWVGLLVSGGVVFAAVLGFALIGDQVTSLLGNPIVPTAVALVYYGIAAFNAWRVHQAAFERRPASLVPWLDRGEGTYLNPL